MLIIARSISIPDNELTITYIHSSGPGGQNVNKVATAVQLRYHMRNSKVLQDEIKMRLAKLAGKKLTQDGVLVIEAKRYRSQDQNRADAEKRLVKLIKQAMVKPKRRQPTRPTVAAYKRRLEAKKLRAEIKRQRREKIDYS